MQVHDVSEYVHLNLQPPQFYVDNILPKEGVMLLYGQPKLGKSWLAQHLGFSVSVGAEWLGFRTIPARTLIANFEIATLAFARRLRQMSQRFELQPQMLYEVSPGLLYIDETENYNLFSAIIRDYHPQVIILDCLAACFGGDENDSRDVARFIEKISRLKTEHEASIVLVHHTNKSLLNNSVDKARGHSRLTGWVDTLVYMAQQPTGVQLQFKARQSVSELHNINVRMENQIWRIVN